MKKKYVEIKMFDEHNCKCSQHAFDKMIDYGIRASAVREALSNNSKTVNGAVLEDVKGYWHGKKVMVFLTKNENTFNCLIK